MRSMGPARTSSRISAGSETGWSTRGSSSGASVAPGAVVVGSVWSGSVWSGSVWSGSVWSGSGGWAVGSDEGPEEEDEDDAVGSGLPVQAPSSSVSVMTPATAYASGRWGWWGRMGCSSAGRFIGRPMDLAGGR